MRKTSASSRRQKIGALAAVLALAAASEASAQSLQTGQCLSREAFNETLVVEGMRTLIIGNRTGIKEDASSPTGARGVDFVNGVAANPEGQGYLFEGDQPRGVNSKTVCVTALSRVTLHDVTSTSIPRSAYLGGRFDNGVDAKAERGERPMIIANTLIGSGSARRNGLPLVLFGNAADRTGAITSMSTDGQPTLLGALHSLEYTPFALEQLASQSRQAQSSAPE